MRLIEVLDRGAVREPLMEGRHYIDLVESQRIGRIKKVPLKDGRVAELEMTLGTLNGMENTLLVAARVDGEYAGSAKFHQNRYVPEWRPEHAGSWSCTDVFINKNFQRLGIASAIYDMAARAGYKIIRSGVYGGKLTPDGSALWDTRREWKKGRFEHPFHWKPKRRPVKPN